MSSKILTDKEIRELLEEDPSLENETNLEPKDAFVDTVNPYKYIELDSNALAFDRVHRALNRNLKMTLIYGSPGTGKSMFLSRLNSELISQRKNSILISSPILNEEQLFQTISFEIFRESDLNLIPQGFDELIESISKEREFVDRFRPIILLDEAQLYSNQTLEKIRLIADSQAVRVIFAVHKLKEENIFAKEHFKSRIWERIELQNASINELKVYIQKKLMGTSMLSLANQFSKRIVRQIYKITGGNYRVTNNLLYAYFNNYPQLWKPQFGREQLKIRAKEIEITAIQIGFIKPKGSLTTDIRHLPTAELMWKRWKNREKFKYISIFLLPLLIYSIFKLYLLNSSGVSTQQIEKDDNSSNISFSQPPQNSIQEPKIEPIPEIVEEKIAKVENEKIETSQEDETQKVQDELENDLAEMNEVPSFEDDFEEESFVEEQTQNIEDSVEEEKIEEQQEMQTSQISDEVVEEKRDFELIEERVENIVSNIKASENTPLDEIDINRAIFKKSIYISPTLNLVKEFSSISPPKESGYIYSLKSQFMKTKTVERGEKILQFYKDIGDYEEIYRFSVELNRLDKTLKEPYLNIEKILLDAGAFEDADKVRDGCKNCNSNL